MVSSCIRALTGLLLAAAVGACSPRPPALKLTVCGDVRTPTEIDALRVELSALEADYRSAGVDSLIGCPGGRIDQLPQTFSFRPPSTRLAVRVKGLHRGATVLEHQRIGRYSGSGSRPWRVRLDRACLGVQCEAGRTCRAGRCEPIPRTPRAGSCASDPAPPTDAGLAPDASPDTQTDASRRPADAGHETRGGPCPGNE
ncbi:MAG: hypothetical protein ABEL76_07790 [Bradymonadaceae bacterium]